MRKLLRYDKSQRYLIFDTETEGLLLTSTKTFQLSWIVCQGDSILEENDYFLSWDDLKMSEESIQVTGFDWNRYKASAEPPREVYDLFKKDLYNPDHKVIAHNLLNFDVYPIKTLQQLLGEKVDFSYLQRGIDTKALAVAIAKGLDYEQRESFLSWQYKMQSIVERGLKSNLEHLLKTHHIEYDPSRLHDSLWDIKYLWELFHKELIWKVSI